MRKKLFGIDLAICSLWIIAVLGSRTAWFGGPETWIVALLVLSRILPRLHSTMVRKSHGCEAVSVCLYRSPDTQSVSTKQTL